MLDAASAVALSLKCPNCDGGLAENNAGPSATNAFVANTSAVRILARYANEGGVQNDLDILPSITEEAYLISNPSARVARAFQLMCSEGDVEGIMDLLMAHSDGQEHGAEAQSMLSYQDPLDDMKTGLHMAIEKTQVDVVWLLLWLCSTLPDDVFSCEVRQAAESSGIGRLQVGHAGDIRTWRTASGASSEDFALREQEKWRSFLDKGLLSIH